MILEFLRGSMSCPVFDPLVSDCPKSVKVAAQPFPSQKHLSGLQLARNYFEAFGSERSRDFVAQSYCDVFVSEALRNKVLISLRSKQKLKFMN